MEFCGKIWVFLTQNCCLFNILDKLWICLSTSLLLASAKFVCKLSLQVRIFSHVSLLLGTDGGEDGRGGGDGWLGRVREEHGRQGVHHG